MSLFDFRAQIDSASTMKSDLRRPVNSSLFNKLAVSILTFLTIVTLTACQIAPLQPADSGVPVPTLIDPSELVIEASAPLPVEQALPPILFQIPELDIEFAVSQMGWTIAERNGVRTTLWVVPADSAGWHVTSVGAGGKGNTILSGQQALGAAVFAPLALGEIQVGQRILLTAEDGQIYAYEVSEISQPIPMIGATAADNSAAAAFAADTDDAQLTLITGWPDFSTTHRLFVVAKFVGQAKAP